MLLSSRYGSLSRYAWTERFRLLSNQFIVEVMRRCRKCTFSSATIAIMKNLLDKINDGGPIIDPKYTLIAFAVAFVIACPVAYLFHVPLWLTFLAVVVGMFINGIIAERERAIYRGNNPLDDQHQSTKPMKPFSWRKAIEENLLACLVILLSLSFLFSFFISSTHGSSTSPDFTTRKLNHQIHANK